MAAFNFKFPQNIDSDDIFTFRQVIITVLKSKMMTDNLGQSQSWGGLGNIASIMNQRLEQKLIQDAKRSFKDTVNEITQKVNVSKSSGSGSGSGFFGKVNKFANDLSKKVDSIVKDVKKSANTLVQNLNQITNNEAFRTLGLDDIKLGDMVKESVTNTAENYINQIKSNTLSKAEKLLGSYVNSVNKILDSLQSEIQGSITLPLPSSFSDDLSHSWNESNGPMKEIMDIVKGAVKSVGNATGKFIGEIKGLSKIGKAAENIISNGIDIGEKLTDIVNLASSQTGHRYYIDNPDYTQKYGGTKPRSFSFKWDLMPNNIQEAKVILNIINALKKYSSPEEYHGTLISPYFFKIQFTNQKLHYLVSPSILVLTKVETNFGSQGIYTTLDGNPKSISISLDFSEVKAPNQNSFSNDEFFQTGESRLHQDSSRWGFGAMIETGKGAFDGYKNDMNKIMQIEETPFPNNTDNPNYNKDLQNKDNSNNQETKAMYNNNLQRDTSTLSNGLKEYNKALNTSPEIKQTSKKIMQSTLEINKAKQDGSFDSLQDYQKNMINKELESGNLNAANAHLKYFKNFNTNKTIS